MNPILSFIIEVFVTIICCSLLAANLRPYLHRILLDLCGNEDRAQFWMVFSIILLVGIPFIFALGYRPEALTSQSAFFEIVGRISGNLYANLGTLLVIGVIISFFVLVAPKPGKGESK
jgi:hypothetical protein